MRGTEWGIYSHDNYAYVHTYIPEPVTLRSVDNTKNVVGSCRPIELYLQ